MRKGNQMIEIKGKFVQFKVPLLRKKSHKKLIWFSTAMKR